jgi:hypothetical protein
MRDIGDNCFAIHSPLQIPEGGIVILGFMHLRKAFASIEQRDVKMASIGKFSS